MFRMIWVHNVCIRQCCDKRVYVRSPHESVFRIHGLAQVFPYGPCYKRLVYTEIQYASIAGDFTVLLIPKCIVQPVGGKVMCCEFVVLSTTYCR